MTEFNQLPPQDKLKAISSNLRRISNWAYEYPNTARRKNIERALRETEKFVEQVEDSDSSPRFQKFQKEFPKLRGEWETAWDNHIRRLRWAEKILTWSNLLD